MALKILFLPLFILTIFFSWTVKAQTQSCDNNAPIPSKAPDILVGIEDDLSIDTDFDLNDLETCGTYYLDHTEEVLRGDLRARASGANYLNALYLINPCSGPAKIQVSLQEATCNQNDEIHNPVPVGGKVKLSSSFSLYSFPDVEGINLVNTIIGEPTYIGKPFAFQVECLLGSKISFRNDMFDCYDQNNNHVIGASDKIECIGLGHEWKPLNNPVPVTSISEIRYDQLFYVDPLNDTVMSSYTPSTQTADDVHSGVVTANGNVPVTVRDCSDPIITEKNHFFTAEGIDPDDSEVKSGDPYRFQQWYKNSKSNGFLTYNPGMTISTQNIDLNNIRPKERVFDSGDVTRCLNRYEDPPPKLISEEECNSYSSSPDYSGPGQFPLMPANNLSVHTSYRNSCALNKTSNDIVCWGKMFGRSPKWSTPTKSNVRHLSTGAVEEDYETVTPPKEICHVDTSNTIHCNFDYHLGNNTTFDSSWFDGEILSYTTAYLDNGTGMCVTTDQGSLYCLGRNENALFTITTNPSVVWNPTKINVHGEYVHEAKLGQNSLCAIVGNERKVKCWGLNKSDSSNLGQEVGVNDTFVSLSGIASDADNVRWGIYTQYILDSNGNEVKNAYKISSDIYGKTICVISYDSDLGNTNLLCWGKNSKFAISDQGEKHHRAQLVDSANSINGHIYKASLLDQALCYVKGGDVLCRGTKSNGANIFGYLGHGFADHGYLVTPYLTYDSTASGKSEVSDIASTASHVCISDVNDEVWCWGWNSNYQSVPTLLDEDYSLIPREVVIGN